MVDPQVGEWLTILPEDCHQDDDHNDSHDDGHDDDCDDGHDDGHNDDHDDGHEHDCDDGHDDGLTLVMMIKVVIYGCFSIQWITMLVE